MLATSKKFSTVPETKVIGLTRNPVTTKKIGINSDFREIEVWYLLAHRALRHLPRGEASQKSTDNVRQLDRRREHARYCHDTQHYNEVSVLLILDVFEHIGANPA